MRTAWQPDMIEGSNQFKLVRSMKCLKKELRRLNRTHFSGITRRVREQGAKVDILQRALLTSPDRPTAIEEHQEGEKLNKLRIAELKFYRQRSRVRWADVGNRNTNFYHKTVDQRVTNNHIHFLKDEEDQFIGTALGIKAHSADYFQRILGHTDMSTSPANVNDLHSLLDFRCSDLHQAYLTREVKEAEIKTTLLYATQQKSGYGWLLC